MHHHAAMPQKGTTMSTRSVIARKTDAGFTGVYHHWDGYPSGVGRTLWQIYRVHFDRDIDVMLKALIDDHPAGWSTINGADWTLPAGPRPDDNFEHKDEATGPVCYPDREANPLDERNASGAGCEYAYVFVGSVMHIYSSVCAGGAKMIGMFGMGDENGRWVLAGTIDLDDDTEPDWSNVDETPGNLESF